MAATDSLPTNWEAMRILSGVMTGGRPSRWPGCGRHRDPLSALDDELPDESGEGGEDVEDQPSARGGGVELFVQRSEPDVVAAQVGHDGDQVLQGAAESGQLGDHEGVAFEELIESLGQAWAGSVFAGELVAVDALAAGFGQGVDLAVEVLVAPAGARVADQGSSGGGASRAGSGSPAAISPSWPGARVRVTRPKVAQSNRPCRLPLPAG
jgi:hypothetical protein